MAITSYVAAHSSELALYAALLLVSYKITVYVQRLYFHPLSAFPGPKICAASRIYEFYWDSVQKGRLWKRLPELHKQYGSSSSLFVVSSASCSFFSPSFSFYLYLGIPFLESCIHQ